MKKSVAGNKTNTSSRQAWQAHFTYIIMPIIAIIASIIIIIIQ